MELQSTEVDAMALSFLTLQQKQVPFEHGRVPVPKCILDPKNPRIQYLIGQRGTPATKTDLYDILWDKDQVRYLAQSIHQNGGVYDDVIVQRTNEGFVVREGNCRAVACMHLMEQYPGNPAFETMPAKIFDEELTEEQLAVLLADMHVASKIRWDAYEQAKSVSDLLHDYGKTFDWMSNHLRLSKGKVSELDLAYKATKEYLTQHPSPENIRKFSFFHEVMKKGELRKDFQASDILELLDGRPDETTFKRRFFRWVSEARLNDARQVRELPKILVNEQALKALDTKGFDAAMGVLRESDPALSSELFAAVKISTQRLRDAPASEIQDLAANPAKLIMLRNLHRALEDLATLASVKL
jgi:hypothetical protein